MNSILTSKWTKVVVFVICLLPLAILVWRGLHNNLSANAVQFVEHWTGVFQKQNGIVLGTLLIGAVCLFIITRGKWKTNPPLDIVRM